MMTSSAEPSVLGFNIGDISSYRLNEGQVVENQSLKQQWNEEEKMTCTAMGNDLGMNEITAGFVDQTAEIEFSCSQNRTSNGGLAPVDWQAGVDQGLFDLTGTVDQSYWSQTQWTDNDHHLNYLP